MKTIVRWACALTLSVTTSVCVSADQTPRLNKVMRDKLTRAQAILAAVITSDWVALDRESRALALVVRDPAWGFALTEPEYLKQSDAFGRAVQDLIEASGRRDLTAAAEADVALTRSCLDCHMHMTRNRIAR